MCVRLLTIKLLSVFLYSSLSVLLSQTPLSAFHDRQFHHFFFRPLCAHTHTHTSMHAAGIVSYVYMRACALSTYARVCLIECYLHTNPSRLLCELVAAQFFACFAHSQMNIYWNPVVNCNVKEAEIFAQLQFVDCAPIYILRSYWAGLT